MIAIGIGCRKGCPGNEIAALVQQACEKLEVGARNARLFTISDKQNEPGIMEAAVLLGLPLVYLPARELKTVEAALATRSQRVTELFGIASVAEAAALAGAGAGARLLAPRSATPRATCAIATS